MRAWAAANAVELVLPPTYGSWLNWIKSEFAALRYSPLTAPTTATHREQNATINACIRWRDTRAEPQTNFAPGSPIRTWADAPAKAA